MTSQTVDIVCKLRVSVREAVSEVDLVAILLFELIFKRESEVASVGLRYLFLRA